MVVSNFLVENDNVKYFDLRTGYAVFCRQMRAVLRGP